MPHGTAMSHLTVALDRKWVRLTGEQYEMLEDLEQGSDERRAYLHGLASDPDVLAAQAVIES